jgi:opacity protein-like surface antigen
MAQEIEPAAYLGAGIANFDYEENILGLATFSDSATGVKLYGGYRFSDRWAFEAAYEQTDTVEQSFSASIPGIGTVGARIGAEFDLITLRGIGHIPVSWGSFFVGAGYFDGEGDAFAEVDDGTTVVQVNDTVSDDGLTAILGLQWDFSSLSLRVEYEWWDLEDADATQIGVGLHYRFR